MRGSLMEFCKHCGKEIKEGIKFCNHCGKNIHDSQTDKDPVEADENSLSDPKDEVSSESEVSAAIADQPSDKKDREKKQTSKKSPTDPKKVKKKNILIFSGLGFIALIIISFVILNKMNSPSHLIKEFEQAIDAEDSEKLSSILTTEEEGLDINKDTMTAFINLYASNKSDLRNMINQLEIQADGHGGGYSVYPVELVKDGKKLLFVDNYKLNLLPVYINVSTTYEGTDIFVNEEKLATADEEYFRDELGPLTPGIHEVKAVYDTGFFHLDKEKEVEISDPGVASLVDLQLEGDNVSFDLLTNNYDQLSSIGLYINGKETDYDLTEESRVGPLLVDGSMNASFEAEFPWGTMKTEDLVIDDSLMSFNFGENKEFQDEIMEIIITFNEELLETYTTGAEDILTTTTKPLQELIIEEAEFNKEQEIVFQGAFHGVDFYMDSFELKKSYDDFWEVNVDTITYTEEDVFLAGDKANLEETEEEIRYEMVFDPNRKEWVISNLGYAGSMDDDKMERYKVEEPVMHTSEWDKKKKKDKKDKD